MQNQVVGRPLAPTSVPWLGGLSRPLAYLGPGQCLCLSRAEIKGRREPPSPLPRHTRAWQDISRVKVVPGLQTWGSIMLGAPSPPRHCWLGPSSGRRWCCRQGRGAHLSRSARTGGLRAGREWLTACPASPLSREACVLPGLCN